MSLSDPTNSVSIRRNDVLLALAFVVVQPTAVFLASSSVLAHLWSWLTTMAVPLVAKGLALVLWRNRPLICQALVWSAGTVTLLLFPATYVTSGHGQFVVSFGMRMRFPLRRTVSFLVALSLAYSTVNIWRRSPKLWQLHIVKALVTLAICLVSILGGVALTNSRRYEHSRQGLLRREHERQLEVALVQERRRLAGEPYNIAVHHPAEIAVQTVALERLIDRDPQTTRKTAQQLRRQAKGTFSGLCSMVGLLRSDGEAGEPSSGLRDLSELMASTRVLDVDIELLDGGLLGDEPGDGTTHSISSDTPSGDIAARVLVLSQRADTAVFRVVQQSIGSALQHAPGAPATMELRRTEDPLELTVLNGPAHRPSTDPDGGDTGLAAVRKRAGAIGGSLHASPVRGGDWRVRSVLLLARGEDV